MFIKLLTCTFYLLNVHTHIVHLRINLAFQLFIMWLFFS
jgi:hypothetical protein